MFDSLLLLTEIDQRQGEIEAEGCVVGLEADGDAEFGDGLRETVHHGLGNSQIAVGVSVGGVEADGLREFVGGLFGMAGGSQEKADMVVKRGVIGQGDFRLAQLGERFAGSSLFAEELS